MKKFAVAAALVLAFAFFWNTIQPSETNETKSSTRQEMKRQERDSVEKEDISERPASEMQKSEEENARTAEEKRLAEEIRLAEEQKALEDARLAEEKRIADEKIAEEKRLAEERRAQEIAERERRREQQLIDEHEAFWEWDAKIQRGIMAVDNDWEELWQYTLNDFSNGYISAQEAFQNLKELEQRLIEDEMTFLHATVSNKISSKYRNQMESIKKDFANWAKARRKASENFHMAIGLNNVNPQSVQKSIEFINGGDALMMRANINLVDLENQIGY